MKKIVGITGNIGCGKSTVSKLISNSHNFIIYVDMDSIAKEIILDPRNKKIVTDIVGLECLEDDFVDRKKLAGIIFNKDNHLKKENLEKWCHSIVWNTVDDIYNKAENSIVLVESAIIVEKNSVDRFDELILVTCDEDEQIRRLIEERKMSIDDVKKRISLQITQDEKLKFATSWIDTHCSLEELKCKCDEIVSRWKEEIDIDTNL